MYLDQKYSFHVVGGKNGCSLMDMTPKMSTKWNIGFATFSITHPLRNIPNEVGIPFFPIWFIGFNFTQDFRRSLPFLENILRRLKSSRLSHERLERIKKRKAAVDSQYNSYLCELNPQLWGYLPDHTRVHQIAPIFEYIYSDDESLISPPESTRAEIHSFVSDWTTFGKAQLSSCINDYQAQMHGYTENSVPHVMDVATVVVICPKKEMQIFNWGHLQALIGWDDARLHLDCITPKAQESKDTSSFIFSAAGHHTAVHLLNLLGLSPTTTKSNLLEGLRARFMCITCPFAWRMQSKGRHAMTFKESVRHYFELPCE